ncbi:hypothetical protein H4R18_004584 [Coemansia javaensis]|uniref:Mediator of RNA polymerase II transcription subunit 20 n=1 Tax=Coemansia javaensis TaxID=2761396 RepID=A0A9W8H5Q8_9FUNG|nr:hypothetical protein H4R18_004584 [Coemansia javaensis]
MAAGQRPEAAGSAWVLWWKDAEGTASLGRLQERILRGLRARLRGRWYMETRLYHSPHNFVELQGLKIAGSPAAPGAPRGTASDRSMYVVVLGEGAARRQYFVMASNRVVVEAEPEMESMIQRLKNLWAPRQSARIEGYAYEGDDWIIRAGNLQVGGSYKGMLIEINYLPCSNPEQTRGLMRELLGMILPPDAQIESSSDIDYRRASLDPLRMTDRHTAYQYVNLFTKCSLL